VVEPFQSHSLFAIIPVAGKSPCDEDRINVV
jgi:hypothetical protein